LGKLGDNARMTPNCDFASLSHARLVDELTKLIWRAAVAVLAIDQSTVKWRAKSDFSPVSAADEAANAVIIQGLVGLLPGVPIVSEEETARKGLCMPAKWFALVDPLDGTREFLAGRDEFTVNIAIVLDGTPIVGLIAAPALRLIWRGIAGRGAERLHLAAGDEPLPISEIRPLRTREAAPGGFVAAVSRSHFDAQTDTFLQRLPIASRVSCGSSLKFCRIAEGSVDVYARLAQTCEWDVAAGHAVLAAAGGTVTTPAGAELVYGCTGDFHVPGFVAWGDPKTAQRCLSR
jgi:3'(2'), 5'-bisphosphate nucleotidase